MTTENKSLEGQVAIITGGSKGIGKATAIEFARNGIHPVLVSRGEGPLQTAVQEISSMSEAQEKKVRPLYISADVSKLEDVQRVVSTTREKYGHVDILVNNAGVYTLDYLKNVPPQKLAQILDINLKGAVLLTSEVLKVFAEQKNGSIIDIGSTAALEILDQNNAYAPSKHGHRVFSNIVDLENPHVNVYRIHPSNTETEGRQTATSDLESQIRKTGKFLPAREIGVEAVKLMNGHYDPSIKEIKVYVDQESGAKKVEKVDAKLVVDYTPLE